MRSPLRRTAPPPPTPARAPLAGSVDFDVVVVGAGVAGCVAAVELARAGRSVLVVERADRPGAKNLSGGVLYPHLLLDTFPGLLDEAPLDRRIVRNRFVGCSAEAAVALDHVDPGLAAPANAVSVLRARLDPWLASQAEAAGAFVMSGVRVDGLIREGGRAVGVRAGADELRAHVVVAADGALGLLAATAGLRPAPDPSSLGLGVKASWTLPAAAIEDRFGVGPGEGAAWSVVGATAGIPGGGFVYTNNESVSVGVVVRLDALAASGRESSAVFDGFCAHPEIARLLAGAELAEYGAHLVPEGTPSLDGLAFPGLLLAGDAAGLVLNTGLAIRGMDLAAASGRAAAAAIGAALTAGDVGGPLAEAYRAHLERLLGAELRTHRHADAFLAGSRLHRQYPDLAVGLVGDAVRVTGRPRTLAARARSAMARSGVRTADLLADVARGVRAL